MSPVDQSRILKFNMIRSPARYEFEKIVSNKIHITKLKVYSIEVMHTVWDFILQY